MRAVALMLVLAFAAVALATEADVDAEVTVETFTDAETEAEQELSVPTLPGLNSGCLPTYSKRNYRSRNWKKQTPRVLSFGGKCVVDSQCAPADQEPGYCAGMGVTCCKSAAFPAPVPAAAGPTIVPQAVVLKAGASPCSTKGGSCQDVSTCKGTTQSNLCPGTPNNVKCCFAPATPTNPTTPTTPTNPTTPTRSLTSLIPIPAGINAGVQIAGASVLISKLGKPGCPLTTSCFSCNCGLQNALISRNVITLAVTPTVRITGFSPYVNAVKRAFDAIKAASASNPELAAVYAQVKTAGGLCCRPIKHSDGTAGSSWSNHSWGCAADFYFGNTIDPRGDGKCQYGLSLMAPFFNAQKLYWAAGYKGSEEDAMHFEASVNSLNDWQAQGLYH